MRKKLHPSGPEFSSLSTGFWRVHEWGMNTTELAGFIHKCLELEITTFDHADIYGDYGNEELFGNVLKTEPTLRDKMELVSKCDICLTTRNRPKNIVQHYNTTAGYVREQVERSLKKLRTDYLDLILIHRPDPLMDASEVADTFSALHREGKIKHAGVSNFTPSQFELLQSKMDLPLVTNQVECSLLHLDPIYDGTFDQAQQLNFSPMIWSPFAGGKLFTDNGGRSQRVRSALRKISQKYNASDDQIALSWLLKNPSAPVPVLGSGKIERISSAISSIDIILDRQDWFFLLEASQGKPVP